MYTDLEVENRGSEVGVENLKQNICFRHHCGPTARVAIAILLLSLSLSRKSSDTESGSEYPYGTNVSRLSACALRDVL